MKTGVFSANIFAVPSISDVTPRKQNFRCQSIENCDALVKCMAQPVISIGNCRCLHYMPLIFL